jgi:hypothetical protein
VVTALALTAALAACGSPADGPASPSPPESSASAPTTVAAEPAELLQQAMRNMREAPSKRLAGTAAVPMTSQEFEVVFVGEDARGTQTARALGLESVVEFVRVGDSIYILASEHYWQSYVNLEHLAQVSGKWVRVAADNPNHAGLLVIEENADFPEPEPPVTRAGTDSVDGSPAVVLEDGAGNRFFVSAEGTPYVLRIEATTDTEVGRATIEITFSDFGTVTETISAPADEIVDLR